MAGSARGRPVHGWLVVDKPPGPSSAAVVASAKRALDARKAGHAGTLDPAATGVLAIAFGEATKTVPYVTEGEKLYRFAVRWGAATTTDDAAGEPVATSPARPDAAAIRAALAGFTGDILQVPPQVSAVKVEGARAYDLARTGTVVELGPRPLHVARLELLEVVDADTAVLEMACGKGGYVRSLARDLGAALGCLAHVLTLRRLRAGPFDLAAAVDGRALGDADRADLEAALLPVEAGLAALPRLDCTPEAAARLARGNPAAVTALPGLDHGREAWAACGGRPVAVGRFRAGALHPTRVFVLP
jgi:tRNA pseudouridine55 synthase